MFADVRLIAATPLSAIDPSAATISEFSFRLRRTAARRLAGIEAPRDHQSVRGLTAPLKKSWRNMHPSLAGGPNFQFDTLLVSERLRLTSIKPIKPSGFFTTLELRKRIEHWRLGNLPDP
jgi:hypothetical protein